MEIKDLINQAYKTALEHGFYDGYNKSLNNLSMTMSSISYESIYEMNKSIPEMEYQREVINVYLSNFINLITSELSEATQEIRKCDYGNMVKELADVYIRLSSFIGAVGLTDELEVTNSYK